MILTDADQLREALLVALVERDEARAEVERLKADRLCQREGRASALRDIAEMQREACAKAYLAHPDAAAEKRMAELLADAIRQTPLVTESEQARNLIRGIKEEA